MKRFLVLAILLGFIPLTFLECNPCKCEDPGPDQHFAVDSMQATVFYDHTYPAGYDTTAFYPYDSLALVLNINKFKQISYTQPQTSFSLYGTAMACDCAGPNYIVDNPITSIQVISQTDTVYNDQLTVQTGDNLTAYVNADISGAGHRTPLSEFFTTYRMAYDYRTIQLYLNAKPNHPMVLTASVLVKLKDGKTFLFENLRLNIK